MAFKLFDRVQETSTSTGTGDITLAGAVTGFSTFSSRYSIGDTLYYGIHTVNSVGTPIGEWEVGLGTYSAANTLTRTTVLSSSNSDAAVAFGAGTKRVFVTLTAYQVRAAVEINTQTTSYTLTVDDAERYIRMNVATANNVTVPTNASVPIPVGRQVHIRQAGAGKTSIVASGGVTVNTPETLNARKQGSTLTLIKVATDTWDLMGDLEQV